MCFKFNLIRSKMQLIPENWVDFSSFSCLCLQKILDPVKLLANWGCICLRIRWVVYGNMTRVNEIFNNLRGPDFISLWSLIWLLIGYQWRQHRSMMKARLFQCSRKTFRTIKKTYRWRLHKWSVWLLPEKTFCSNIPFVFGWNS